MRNAFKGLILDNYPPLDPVNYPYTPAIPFGQEYADLFQSRGDFRKVFGEDFMAKLPSGHDERSSNIQSIARDINDLLNKADHNFSLEHKFVYSESIQELFTPMQAEFMKAVLKYTNKMTE